MMKAMVLIWLLLSTSMAFCRSPTEGMREFRRTMVCPATGVIAPICKGYVIDHIVPLCAGGADALSNLQWQERRASYRKDADERRLCRWLRK